ncbi:MAG TPA: hypothetical protein VFU60_18820, partial [Ktedonobacterales bacterium]|nr:hypothetical protein [Ktedonobacterales bacterium]
DFRGPLELNESMSAVPLLAEIKCVGERAIGRVWASVTISLRPPRSARRHMYHRTLRNVGAR